MRRTIIVTDVTEMHSNQFCVAGWDASAGRMVRPLPDGSNWPSKYIATDKLWPGNTFQFDEASKNSNGDFPHRTEDTIISTTNLKIGKPANDAVWLKAIANSAAPTVSAAFQGKVQWREYDDQRYHTVVPRGSQGPSLGATIIKSGRLEFLVDDRNKLRGLITDSEGTYKLPVVAHQINEVYRKQGVEALNRAFSKGACHVRLGCARAYSFYPDECFVMLNGAYLSDH